MCRVIQQATIHIKCAWFLCMYIYSLSVILILMVLEVEMQPCTLLCSLWFSCRISMDTAGGIWNKSQHIIACWLQNHKLIFSAPFTLYCCCLWMVLHHPSFKFPACHSGCANDTGAKHNWTFTVLVWCEKKCRWQNKTCLPPVFQQNVNIVTNFILERNFQLSENRRAFSKSNSSIKVLLTLPPSYTLPEALGLGACV